jgi:two-component system nitrate/nitrite response regulator NarL
MDIQPVSVLVIESHPMMREALRNAIAEESDLILAESGMNGSTDPQMVIDAKPDAILLAEKPDIILLTFGNPGLDDQETLKILQEALPGTPILALTSNEVEGQEQAALEAGSQAVLTKAASRVELIEKLRQLGNRKTLENTKAILLEEVPIKVLV